MASRALKGTLLTRLGGHRQKLETAQLDVSLGAVEYRKLIRWLRVLTTVVSRVGAFLCGRPCDPGQVAEQTLRWHPAGVPGIDILLQVAKTETYPETQRRCTLKGFWSLTLQAA